MKIINNIALFFILLNNPAVCQNKQDKIDICNKKVALTNLETVQRNAKEIITTSNDDCVLGLLDTLTILFIKTQQTKYIKTLDAICQIKDGYVGEYFWEITEKLVFQSFGSFIEYLSLQKESSCFEKDLLEIMKWELKDGTNPRKEKLIKLIDEKFKSEKNQKTKNYLINLRKKFT